MSKSRRRLKPPPADDHDLRHVLFAAAVQDLVREVLMVILRELVRGGPWY